MKKTKGAAPHTTMGFTVRIADAGPDGGGCIAAVGDYLQEAAADSARRLGFDASLMRRHGLGWVLTREYITMRRYPRLGERVEVETWPASIEKNRARREFILRGAEGEELGIATSQWVAMDMTTRRLASVPQEVIAMYPETPEHSVEFPSRVVPRLKVKEGTHVARIHTRRSDIDVNGHVNNVRYMAWALDALPEAVGGRPLSLDISFRAESGAGQVIVSHAAFSDDGTCLHSLVREDDGGEVARLKTVWSR